MSVTVENQSSVKKILHIEVPEEQVTRELESAYTQLKKTAKIKGFRPGKAPRSVLERLYGRDVKADVGAKLIQNAWIDALKETNLKVLGSPKVDPPDVTPDSPYIFDAEVEVEPEIEDIDYKGLSLTKTKYVVSDQETDMQLNLLRRNLAKRNPIEEKRPVAKDDFVVIDYEGFIEGKPHKDTQKNENFTTQVGKGQIVKDLDNGLIGMQVGDEKEIDVTFPEDYFNASLAGQKIVFRVTMKEIREEILPDLDDAFAVQVSDQFKNLDDLKNKIRENLQNGYEKRIEQELNEQIFTQILEKTSFEVPEILVQGELDHIIRDAEQKFASGNRKLEDVGLSVEKLAEQYRPTAEKQVRRHLILSKLMNQEKLEPTDEEIQEGFQEMADVYGQAIDFIKSYYEKNTDGFSLFKHTLLEKKVLKLIINHSKISEVEPSEKNTNDNDEAATNNEAEHS